MLDRFFKHSQARLRLLEIDVKSPEKLEWLDSLLDPT